MNVILLIVQLAMKLKLQNILNEEVLEAFLQIGTLVEPTYYLSAVHNFSEMSFSILNTYSEIIKEQCIFDYPLTDFGWCVPIPRAMERLCLFWSSVCILGCVNC